MVSSLHHQCDRTSIYFEEPNVRVFLCVATTLSVIATIGCGAPKPTSNGTNRAAANKTGFMANSPEENARQVMEQVMATPEGRATATRLADKDDQLTAFQRVHGISERIAEAAIKEWVMTHGRDFDWNLEDVKAICLRNQREGIPHQWLPEAEK